MHWRSGSRPWTCVHAHGHDVDPIMEASYNNSYFPGIISSGIGELILCNRGSDHVSPWFRFSCKFEHLSSAKQYPSPTSTLICRRVLPPGISRLSWNCITSNKFFIKCYIPTESNFSRALSYYTLKDTDNWIEFALRFNKYLNPSLLTNLLILQSHS